MVEFQNLNVNSMPSRFGERNNKKLRLSFSDLKTIKEHHHHHPTNSIFQTPKPAFEFQWKPN